MKYRIGVKQKDGKICTIDLNDVEWSFVDSNNLCYVGWHDTEKKLQVGYKLDYMSLTNTINCSKIKRKERIC